MPQKFVCKTMIIKINIQTKFRIKGYFKQKSAHFYTIIYTKYIIPFNTIKVIKKNTHSKMKITSLRKQEAPYLLSDKKFFKL